ncbi:MAG TPA: DNA-binding protein [Polyangiaceae bacterium]|nr:DNA-binding protein [Polyangiaceae bacterium]
MANSLDDRIRARVEQFASELAELIRESAMETVSVALAGARPSPGRGGGRRGAAAPVAVGRGGRGRAAASREKGAKRPPDEIERLTGRLLDYVKGNPGQRIEQIADGMGTSTKELNLPAKKLISGKQLRTKGQKRATQYFAR